MVSARRRAAFVATVSLLLIAVVAVAGADVGGNGRVVIAGEHGLTIWDLASGRLIRTINRSVYRPVFSPDGRLIVGANGNSATAVVIDASTGRVRQTLHGKGSWLFDLQFSSDGSFVVGLDGEPLVTQYTTVGVWSTKSGKRLRTFECGDGHCSSAQLSGDGKRLLAPGIDLRAKLWDVRTGRVVRAFGPGTDSNGWPTEAWLTADGRFVVVAVTPGTSTVVYVYDTATGRTRFVVHRAENASLSPDGTLLASRLGPRTIRIHDIRTGRLVKTMRAPVGTSDYSLVFSGNDRLGSYDSAHSPAEALWFWDVAHGRLKCTIRTPFEDAMFSRDGRTVVTVGGQESKVWDTGTCRLLHTLHT